MLVSIWSFIKWMNNQKVSWAIVAGILSGFSIYVKSSAFFFLAPAFISVVIQRYGYKDFLKKKHIWIIGTLSTLPYLIYLFYGVVVLGTLGEQFGYRFFPQRWIQPLFYLQWILELDGTIDFVIVLAAVLGITLFTGKKYFSLLAGFLLGYVLYGFVFSYHITTHDYYHLPLIIPVSIGIGILLGKIFNISERNKVITKLVFTLAALFFIGINAWEIRSTLSRYDYAEEVNNWEMVGEKLGHEAKVIGLFPDYGYRLAYWGWTHVSSWTTSDDVTLRELAGQEVDLQSGLQDKISGFDFFIVANQEEYENQTFLKEYFESNFLKREEVGDIIIYDLRAGVE